MISKALNIFILGVSDTDSFQENDVQNKYLKVGHNLFQNLSNGRQEKKKMIYQENDVQQGQQDSQLIFHTALQD